ncbi:GNAT family N-acetyltransferase [Pontivivens ytuae]|uniref:GNAT family N-acetyltransferase n=1 Tax=Pontivivens ytuae TaxID=2789856 RepID=A0A7S9LNF3_9RHOB|nr:GNAT family protein [Pontivivens ytuae]QPH52309.1 GNAT family N-acetyltransferase [Pontivivens ytuae]
MRLIRRPTPVLMTDRLYLRPPILDDHVQWARLRREGWDFLSPWEPVRAPDHLSRSSFRGRVHWSRQAIRGDRAVPLFLFRREDDKLLGAITLDNIQRGPAQYCTVGYWIGANHARKGYMREALTRTVEHAFKELDLSRVQAACLPENAASRGLLEQCGFHYEGIAQSYLNIAGRWRNHVIYAALREDRLSSE